MRLFDWFKNFNNEINSASSLSNNYFYIEVDKIKEVYSLDNDYIRRDKSFIDGIDIVCDRLMVRKVNFGNYILSDKIVILIPSDKYNIINDYIFDYYVDSNIKLDDDCVVIISSYKFNELSDMEKSILSKCKVVFSEEAYKFNYISNYNGFSFDDNNVLIKVNHMIYLVDNSSLDFNRKEYYKYKLSDLYFKFLEGKGVYFSLSDICRKFSLEVEREELEQNTYKFNELSSEEKKKDVDKINFSSSVFLGELGDISRLSAFSILSYIGRLNEENQKEVFDNELVCNEIRGKFFKEIQNDPWRFMREIYSFIDIKYLIKVLDGEFLSKYFDGDRKTKVEYVFYAALCERDINAVLEYCLIDDKFFEMFFGRANEFRSSFNNIKYDVLIKLLNRIEEKGINFINVFSVDKKDQYELLKEPFSDEMLVWLVERFDKEVLNFFFQNDERAFRLFDKFNLNNLLSDGIKFNDIIINNPLFFEIMKSYDLISFRHNINLVENHNYSVVFSNRVRKYYEGILDSYDNDNKMFRQYIDLFYGEEVGVDRDNYIYDSSVLFGEKSKQLYRKITNKKISEVIVDALFQDNIYNVFLNIKEMLRYNSLLSESDRVLDGDKVLFYQSILDIDRISCEDKIKLYYELRDKNINLMFYTDLRKLKDLSYKNIRKDIIRLGEHSDYKSNSLSLKYGVDVYDLRDKEYTMLVRRLTNRYRNKIHYRRSCYTLLSNINTCVVSEDDYMYGYEGFDDDCVLHVFERDAFSGDFYADDVDIATSYVNRIATSDQIVTSDFMYSEIQIVNKKTENNRIFDTLRPDYLIVFDDDNIDDYIIEESKRLRIPVVVIKKNLLSYNRATNVLEFDECDSRYVDSDSFLVEGRRR